MFIQRFDLKQEDTLEKTMHIDLRFEAIVANPLVLSGVQINYSPMMKDLANMAN